MKKAVIFDLDGVIVSTDEFHYRAWKYMADEEGIYFDKEINERLRGVSRTESLEIILERASKEYSNAEKQVLMERKNICYKTLLKQLCEKDILPGVLHVLEELKKQSVKTAVGSSSKNAVLILNKIGLYSAFDAIADGNGVKNSKPDPEVFLLAATLLGESPEDCVVVEDAFAGIDAAKAAGSKALGVGYAACYEKADYTCKDLSQVDLIKILA